MDGPASGDRGDPQSSILSGPRNRSEEKGRLLRQNVEGLSSHGLGSPVPMPNKYCKALSKQFRQM